MTSREIDTLIKQTANGDYRAFGTLYDELKGPVYCYALHLSGNSHLAEDVLQDTFISVIGHAGSCKLNGQGRSWILSIARNKTLNLLKQQNKALPLTDEHEEQPDGVLTDETVLDQMAADSMLDTLTEKERRIVTLRVFVGLTLTETARALCLPKGSVFWSYSNAMKKLKKVYGAGLPVPRERMVLHDKQRNLE